VFILRRKIDFKNIFQVLHEAKNAAHIAKFGTEKPWTYGGIEME